MNRLALFSVTASRRRAALVVFAAVTFTGAAADAQVADPWATAPSTAAVSAMTDGLVGRLLESGSISGAAVAVVYQGRTFVASGYGETSHASKQAVTPDTRFGVGTLTEVVTALAAMRMDTRGDLNLDADVRSLGASLDLSFAFQLPVTSRHLLTHSSGLDGSHIGTAWTSEEDPVPLQDYLRSAMTRQIAPPGMFFIRSKQGVGLLGGLMELASKTSFAALVKREVFQPLGMTSSTLDSTQIDPRGGQVAVGHRHPQPVRPMSFTRVPPADGLFTSARDMAKLMSALMAGEHLSADVRARMLETGFVPHPRLQGQVHGLTVEWVGQRRETIGNRRILSSSSCQSGFTSEMLLSPGRQLGLFAAVNSEQPEAARKIVDAIFARYFSAPANPALPTEAVSNPGVLAGVYERVASPRSTVEGVDALFDPRAVEFGVNAGALTLDGVALRSLGQLGFVSPDDERRVLFLRTGPHPPHHALVDGVWYRRASRFTSAAVHRQIYFGTLAVFLLSLLTWMTRARSMYFGEQESLSERWSRWLITSICALHLTDAIALQLGLSAARSQGLEAGFAHGLPWLVSFALWAPVLPFVGSVIAVALIVRAFSTPYWNFALRVAFAVGVVASLAHVAVLSRWSLIGA